MVSAAPAEELSPPPEQMTPTMPYGVGIDTHKAFIQVCILYQNNMATERVEREFQTTWPDLQCARDWIVLTLQKHGHWKDGDLLRYTIESTGCYHIPVCQALGGVPSVINPMLAGPTRRKTDVLDARMLAHHSIISLWRPSYVLPESGEILRCLLAMRNEATRNASRLINRVNNHALRFGHTLGRDGSLADMQRRATIEDLCKGVDIVSASIRPTGIPESARPIFLDSYRLYDMYRGMVKEYERLTVQFCKSRTWPTEKGEINGGELIKNLTSVPSVGIVTALTWLSVIHDPRRFQDKKQVAAYCGSDPSVKVSAGKTTSHVKRKGNARLHHALKNCASQLVRCHKDPLGQWGYNILRRHRKGSWGRAISAVARRLAIILWHVHRTGFAFSYEQYRFMMTPEVTEMPIDDTGLSDRYKAILKFAGFNTTGDVARGFMTTLPQQKGIGVGCLTAVKEWLDQNRVAPPPPQSNPLVNRAQEETKRRRFQRLSGPESPPTPTASGSSAQSTAAQKPSSPPTSRPASRKKKSPTASSAKGSA